MLGTVRSRWFLTATGSVSALLVVAACGSSGSKSSTPAAAPTPTTPAAATTPAPSSSPPGASFSTAEVSGLGTVVVDGRGETVYLLTADGHTNVPCDDASGCTKYWPDLALPAGTTAATAGTGIDASKLSTMKLADGQTYPTYGGFLMYEFSKDTGPGQAHGQGVKSFGGTWWVISPTGTPITTSTKSTPATTAPSSGNGY